MKNKIKALIIDDEYYARIMIKNLLVKYEGKIEIASEAQNGIEAVKLIREHEPDLIFLDINMPGLNGFEVLAKIDNPPFVIFTTAYEEFALKAFDANAVDYLVKPIESKRFDKAIEKFEKYSASGKSFDNIKLKEALNGFTNRKSTSSITIKSGDKIFFVKYNDIAYFEAKDKYVYAVTSESKKHLTDTSLTEFEESLPGNFLRVQKSFIVNKDYVAEMHKYFGNRFIISLNDKDKTKITTGITFVNKIREEFHL